MSTRPDRPPVLAWVSVVAVGAFMIAPLVFVVVNSFNASAVSTFPPTEWSLRWYKQATTDTNLWAGFVLSVRVALLSAAMSTVAGTLAAYALTRTRLRSVSLVQAVLNAPLSMPRIAIGLTGLIAYLTLTSWLPWLPTLVSGEGWLAVVHAAFTMPLVIGIVISSLEAMDTRIEAAARDLGASFAQTAARVLLPVLAPTLSVAFGFSFMLSFDELESSLFMASLSGNTLPVVMFIYLETRLDPTLAALSTLLLAAVALAAALGRAALAGRGLGRRLALVPSRGRRP